MYTLAKCCRACGGQELVPVFSLSIQPPANDYCLASEERAGFAPLEILFCPRCTLSQLSVIVDRDILYRRYLYCTNRSHTMRRHFSRLLMDIESEQNGLGKTSQTGLPTILEIGSNDGTFLQFCKDNNWVSVCGIDPARNLAHAANDNGIRTIPEYFDHSSANTILGVIGSPSVVLARHCFAHMDGWHSFVSSLEIVANTKTIICIEVPWVHDMLSRTEFDTAYFEHLSYVSLFAVAELLKGSPFRIHRICHYSIHGGSLLIMLRHRDSGITPHLSADEYLAEDAVTVQHWERFGVMARRKIEVMRQTILDYVSKGKIVCGFGASAKASVWINAMGLTRKEIQFVSDNSPLKPGRLMPGSDIPIIAQDELLSRHPDVAIGFAWNFRAECLNATTLWRERGGKFIFPTPEGVEIV